MNAIDQRNDGTNSPLGIPAGIHGADTGYKPKLHSVFNLTKITVNFIFW